MLTLVLDTRERDLQKACIALSLPFVVEALAIGDVAIRSKETKRKVEDPTKGKEEEKEEKEEEQQDEQEESLVLLLERKSVNDLLSSIKDGRYEEQSYRLVHASGLHPHNIVYIVEGTQSAFRAAITDKQTLHSAIVSLQQYKGFSVMRTGSLQETAEYLLFLCKKLEKEGLSRLCYTACAKQGTERTEGQEGQGQEEEDKDKGKAYCSTMGEVRYGDVTKKVKKDNITPANAGAMLLSQLPGMSYATAVDVLQPYEGSLPAFLDAARHDPKTALTQVLPISKKRLRSNVVQGIKSLLLHID